MAAMTPATAARLRQSSEDRREQVLEAAVREFAEQGYHAASTAAIARRAGISQPYIYALFPNKKELFLAAHDAVIGRIRLRFREAARGAAGPLEALERMGMTYPELIGDRFALLFQLQSYAAAAEPDIRAHVAAAYRSLADEIRELCGATPQELAGFLAGGMLANVTTALGLQDICDPLWEAKHTAAPTPST
jgi:AcrR family transcriptional regulator